MKLFTYRTIRNGLPVGVVGVVGGNSKEEIKHLLDQPEDNEFHYELRPCKNFWMCFLFDGFDDSFENYMLELDSYQSNWADSLVDAEEWEPVDWESDEDWLARCFAITHDVTEDDEMYWFAQAERYHEKIIKLQKSNDQLIKSINALMAKAGHA